MKFLGALIGVCILLFGLYFLTQSEVILAITQLITILSLGVGLITIGVTLVIAIVTLVVYIFNIMLANVYSFVFFGSLIASIVYFTTTNLDYLIGTVVLWLGIALVSVSISVIGFVILAIAAIAGFFLVFK